MTACVVVRPPREDLTKALRQLHRAVKTDVQRRRWDCQLDCEAVRVPSYGSDTVGRSTALLLPQDVESIYRLLHVEPTVVITLAAVRVRPDPRKDPAPARTLVPLDQLVRYKAGFALPRGIPEVAQALDRAASDLQQLSCASHLDPRVLPLHVFAPEVDCTELGTQAGRDQFVADFHQASRRRDNLGREWSKGAFHGLERLTVAGCALPQGFHWDVASEKAVLVCNGWEVWQIRKKGYTNVSPDGGIRRGQRVRGTPSKRLWHRGDDL